MSSHFGVLTPVRNGGAFLPRCLSSVRQQDRPVSHVVADAASDDGTIELLASMEDPNLLWASAPDSGMTEGLRKAYALLPAEVDIVGWLNADEYYEPNILSAVARIFESEPSVVVVYGDFARVTENGQLIRINRQWSYDVEIGRLVTPIVQNCAAFFRRSAIDEAGGFSDDSWRLSMDWDLYRRLARVGRFVYVNRVLASFTMHPSSQTSSSFAGFVGEADRIRREEFPHLSAKRLEWLRRRHYLRLCWQLAKNGTLLDKALFKVIDQRAYQAEYGALGKDLGWLNRPALAWALHRRAARGLTR